MKVKSGYIVKKVMGSYMLVSPNGESGTMQTMNETGAYLWDLLTKDTTVDEMVAKMVKEYDVDAACAKSDIENFISKLRSSNLLDE